MKTQKIHDIDFLLKSVENYLQTHNSGEAQQTLQILKQMKHQLIEQ